jgi:uncharacterized protein YuzE
MKVKYYPETDTLYIELKEGVSVESEEVAEGVVVDYDERGEAIGIEIDGVRKARERALPFIGKLIPAKNT